MKNIILVGNGTSVLDNQLGHLVNGYDTVVRFSYYWITGYEQYVGEKTDIWFTTVAQNGFRSKTNYREIYEHSWEWDIDKDKTYSKLVEMFPDTPITKTERQICTDIENYSGIHAYTAYSTGTIAAYMFSKLYGHVTLYGFDWWDKHRSKHHYGDSQKIGNLHKPDLEHQIIKQLERDNRVCFLTD